MNEKRNDESQHKTGVGVTGKGFVKGDPRINRKGRPKHFQQFRELAQMISHEKVIAADGSTITRVEAILRSWSKSKCPQLQALFVQYAYGKPPDKLEVNELEPKTTLILHYAHEFDRLGRDRGMIRDLQPPDDDNGASRRLKGA